MVTDQKRPGRRLASYLAFVGFFLASGSFAGDQADPVEHGVTDPEGYWGRKAEGWFFYAPMGDGSGPEAGEPGKPPAETSPRDPAGIPLTAAWLRLHLPRYLDLALDNPTPENVRAFLYLQRLALDRASAFAAAVAAEVAGNPLLDENVRRPVSTLGGRLLDERARRGEETVMSLLGSRAGIIYVFDPGDGTSPLFSPLVRSLERDYGIHVRSARTGSGDDPSGLFPDAPAAPDLRERLGFLALPAVYLYTPSGGLTPVSQGVISRQDLVRRIIAAARREGALSPEEFALTRPVLPLPDLPRRAVLKQDPTGLPPSPAAVVEYFEGRR